MFVPETSNDQAAGLRRITNPSPVRVIAVTGGKGGVGKTNVSVNLAASLARSGKDVMLLDADLGLANVDVLLGLQSAYNLSHVISGERTLSEIILEGPLGVKVVPASSGIKKMADLTPAEHAGLIHAFSELSGSIDTLIVDTAAGIFDGVVSFVRAAQEVIVVVCDEPASITDAYALMKLMCRHYGKRRFRVLANMTHSAQEGRHLFNKLMRVADRFLDVSLDYLGAVPADDYVRKAVQKQRCVVETYPGSRSATAFMQLARETDRWPLPTRASGQLEFFVEQLVAGNRREGGWQ